MLRITKTTSPASRSSWHELMTVDAHAVPYQSPGWTDAICSSHKLRDISREYHFSDGSFAVLPLVARQSQVLGNISARSMPNGCGMGGVLVSAAVESRHLRLILEDLGQLSYAVISIRPNPTGTAMWREAAEGLGFLHLRRRAHVIDLRQGFTHVRDTLFSRDTRRRLKKAHEEDIEIANSDEHDLIPVFYELMEKSVVRWARRQNEPLWLARKRFRSRDPIEKFRAIVNNKSSPAQVWAAFLRGQPVAASLVLLGRNANDARGAIDRDALQSSAANDYLQMKTIERACEFGCQYYHLGESGSSQQLAHYKSRFGGVSYDYDELLIESVPLTRMTNALKDKVKKVIGFKD